MAVKGKVSKIHKLYRRDALEKLWFGFVHGMRKGDPKQSLFAIHLEFCDHFVEFDDFDYDAASTLFYRMQHEIMQEPLK